MFGKNNQRDIIWKLRKGEQSFLCATRRRDLIRTLIKLHEDIPNGYCYIAYKNSDKIIKEA